MIHRYTTLEMDVTLRSNVVVRQKGSHVVLQRGSNLLTVPLHDPVKKSTLNAILKQADVSLEELLEQL